MDVGVELEVVPVKLPLLVVEQLVRLAAKVLDDSAEVSHQRLHPLDSVGGPVHEWDPISTQPKLGGLESLCASAIGFAMGLGSGSSWNGFGSARVWIRRGVVCCVCAWRGIKWGNAR